MERAMQLYYERWKFRHPSLADLRDALAEGTGKPLIVNAAFDAYIYGTGKTDDRISSMSSQERLPMPAISPTKASKCWWGAHRSTKPSKPYIAWKAKHPKAKAGAGAFPYHTVIVVRAIRSSPRRTLRVNFADGSHRDYPVTTAELAAP